jgi:alkylation response protein AidB-like acyl-CoA dehydrogenase
VNFEFTDDQQAIKRTARDFLAARYKLEHVRSIAEAGDERGFSDAEWAALMELGWPGVTIAEEYGGLGLGAVELIVIAEELGYALAPTPLMPSIWAALLIQAGGSDAQKAAWLPKLASGEARGTVAIWDEHAGLEPDRSEAELLDGTVTATKIAVPDAASADVLVLSGANGGHFLVEGSGVTITPEAALDTTRRLFRVALADAPAEALSHGGSAALARAYGAIVTSIAAENVGVGQRAMEMAVEYAKDRKQFDMPIGVHQAISHRCAQMLLEVEGARSLSYGAAWALDHSPETAPRAASMAKAYAGDAGFRVTASAIQVHGGIGFTWEHDLHFFFKRAKANAHAFGDGRWHRERVAALTGL